MKRAARGNSKAKDLDRGGWLNLVGSSMRAWFDDLSFPLPPFEVRTGFPSSGRRSPNTAESWSDDDGSSFVIFVRPDREDPIEVAGAIAFQLCRIAVGQRDNHGYLFRHLAISIGLRGTKTESKPGTLFQELVAPILKDAGALPAAALTRHVAKTAQAQGTRLIKVSCRECGYVARVSRKWLDSVGPPSCPLHGPMEEDR